MDKRRMCPGCRAFITTDDKVCPYCEMKLGPRAIDLRVGEAALGGLIPAGRFVTTLLLIVNTAIFVALVTASRNADAGGSFMNIDGNTLLAFGAKFKPAIAAGQWWRLLTAGFLHGGLIHIGMNSWVLLDIGPQVEEVYGAGRMISIYLISTVTGFFASYLLSNSLSVGASAGILGLVGAMIGFGFLFRESSMAQAIKASYLRWAIIIIVAGFILPFPLDNWAHLGGLLGGLGVALVAGVERRDGGWQDRLWRGIGLVCVAVTGLCFAYAIMWRISV